jgi:hypothetical protein
MTELAPCPWCYHDDRLEIRQNMLKFWEIYCGFCKAVSPVYANRELAIEAWNARKNFPLCESLEDTYFHCSVCDYTSHDLLYLDGDWYYCPVCGARIVYETEKVLEKYKEGVNEG